MNMLECEVLEPDEIRVDAPDEIYHDAPQPMIKSLQIENFRCFQKLNIDDLGFVNVLVGENAGGKTSLLEAIFLPGGNYDLIFRLKNWRGLNAGVAFARSKTEYESLWRDSFFRFSQEKPIKISLSGSPENKRTLRIYYDPAPNQLQIFPPDKQRAGDIEPDSSAIVPITFEITDANGNVFKNQPVVHASGQIIATGSGGVPTSKIVFFVSNILADASYSAGLYSQLGVRNEEHKVKEILRRVFPQISDLSLFQVGTGGLSIYCTVPNLSEKLPVGLVSSGIHKLLAILLGIASNQNGAVLIDEIENGFHYSVLHKVWEAILEFRQAYNVQLFISSHSKEFLASLGTFAKESPEKFRLLRAESLEDGSHTVRVFSGEDFEAALETDSEFR
jgi:hypothetical protein